MSEETFLKVLSRLKEFDEHEVPFNISFGYLGEGTLDANLWDRVDTLTRELKNASVGLHTNGLLLDKYAEKLNKLDFIVTSILGSPEGDYSFEKNTGLSYKDHISRIYRIRENYDKQITIIRTLPAQANNSIVNQIATDLKEANVAITFNRLVVAAPDGRSNMIHTPGAQKVAIVSTPVSKTNLSPLAYTRRGAHSCALLVETCAISVEGVYSLCCVAAFGTNTPLVSVHNTTLHEHMFGRAKNKCLDFLHTYQTTEITCCTNCVLFSTFGPDTKYCKTI
jgi:hypothetical protein